MWGGGVWKEAMYADVAVKARGHQNAILAACIWL